MTRKEAIEILKSNKPTSDPRECGKELCTAVDMAIEALEKRIPKKPVNYDSVPHSRCPVCNNAVKVFEDAHEYHYCLYCGQALDWEEEDET